MFCVHAFICGFFFNFARNNCMFYVLDIIGTMAFAMSGALTAISKRLDPFGVFIIAFVTAVGGGMLRDVLIGTTPVSWMRDLNYVYVICAGFVMAIIFRKKLDRLRTSLFLFDTIGLGVFTLIGLERGITIGLHPIICIALGTMTACFGGVLRDILCNEIPVIFRRQIYATICIFGGIVFFGLKELELEDDIVYIIASLLMILVRLLAVKYKWSLPPLEQ